jgi:germination protein M
LIACAGLGVYLAVSRKPVSTKPTIVRRPPVPGPAVVQKSKEVKVYRVAVENNQPKLRPTKCKVKAGENPMEVALRQLIEQGGTADLASPIPEGTRLLSLEVKGDLAIVNLSREFRDNFTGGSEEEALTIGAILKTLGQFPQIKRVLFKVEGKPLDTLGHLDLSGPQDVTWVGSSFDSVSE